MLRRWSEFCNTKQEVPTEAWHLTDDKILSDEGWPLNGGIVFDKMSLKYRPNLLPAVENVSLNITGGENVGNWTNRRWQSTLMVALFRLVDPYVGKIYRRKGY